MQLPPVSGPGYGYQPMGEKPVAEQFREKLNTIWARAHDMSGQTDEEKVLEDFRDIHESVGELYDLIPHLPAHMREDAAHFCRQLGDAVATRIYMDVGNDKKMHKDVEAISKIMAEFKSFLGVN